MFPLLLSTLRINLVLGSYIHVYGQDLPPPLQIVVVQFTDRQLCTFGAGHHLTHPILSRFYCLGLQPRHLPTVSFWLVNLVYVYVYVQYKAPEG